MDGRSRLTIDRRGRSGRQWVRVDFYRTGAQAHPVSAELLGERRRRAAVLEPILEAVPRTSHAGRSSRRKQARNPLDGRKSEPARVVAAFTLLQVLKVD
jgi:hypothetical protein